MQQGAARLHAALQQRPALKLPHHSQALNAPLPHQTLAHAALLHLSQQAPHHSRQQQLREAQQARVQVIRPAQEQQRLLGTLQLLPSSCAPPPSHSCLPLLLLLLLLLA